MPYRSFAVDLAGVIDFAGSPFCPLRLRFFWLRAVGKTPGFNIGIINPGQAPINLFHKLVTGGEA